MSQEYESVELVDDDTVRNLALAAVLAAFTAALAQLSIPIPSVGIPFSLQPFGSFFAGVILGPVWGGFAMALYLAAGAAGAPVFANGTAGIGQFGGDSGGFLVGFLVGAVVTGAITHRQVTPRSIAAIELPALVVGVVAGLLVIYAVGIPWMAFVLGLSLVEAVVAMTVTAPYFPLDVVKVLVTVGVVEGGHLAVAERS